MARKDAPERPDSVRAETWHWLPEDARRRIDQEEHVGRIMLKLGILKHPELLQETVIEFEDGVEYLIPREAAELIAGDSDQYVTLRRIYDGKERSTTQREVTAAIRDWNVFDQLDKQPDQHDGGDRRARRSPPFSN